MLNTSLLSFGSMSESFPEPLLLFTFVISAYRPHRSHLAQTLSVSRHLQHILFISSCPYGPTCSTRNLQSDRCSPMQLPSPVLCI